MQTFYRAKGTSLALQCQSSVIFRNCTTVEVAGFFIAEFCACLSLVRKIFRSKLGRRKIEP